MKTSLCMVDVKLYIRAYGCVEFGGKILEYFNTHYALSFIHISCDINWPIVWGFREFRSKEREVG